MKNTILGFSTLAFISLLTLSGCSQPDCYDRTSLTEHCDYKCAKFDISPFEFAKPFKLKIYNQYDKNDESFVVLKQDSLIDFIEYTRTNKEKYNLLIKELKSFNSKVNKDTKN